MLTLTASKAAQRSSQRGQVLVWVVVLLPLLLVIAGLVIDGGFLFLQYQRARWSADGAAVAAASVIDPVEYRDFGRVELTENAKAVANDYARRNHPGMVVDKVWLDENVIHIQARVKVEFVFMKMFGFKDSTITVLGTETPYWGSSTEGE